MRLILAILISVSIHALGLVWVRVDAAYNLPTSPARPAHGERTHITLVGLPILLADAPVPIKAAPMMVTSPRSKRLYPLPDYERDSTPAPPAIATPSSLSVLSTPATDVNYAFELSATATFPDDRQSERMAQLEIAPIGQDVEQAAELLWLSPVARISHADLKADRAVFFIEVSEMGSPTRVTALDILPEELQKALEEALYASQFRPAQRRGANIRGSLFLSLAWSGLPRAEH
jgi:hypothetical protein